MGLAQHIAVLARASPDLRYCEDSVRISTQLFVAGSVLVAIVISPCSTIPPRCVDHLQECEDGPPVPHGTCSLQLRGKVVVRQLAARDAIGVVQVDVAPSHRKRIG